MPPNKSHLTSVPQVAESPKSATDRLVAMLTDPSEEPITLTRAQLAYLMGTAQRWGYEARVDEENAAYPPVPVFTAGETISDLDRKARRDAADARTTSNYQGGPVPIWGDDEEMAA